GRAAVVGAPAPRPARPRRGRAAHRGGRRGRAARPPPDRLRAAAGGARLQRPGGVLMCRFPGRAQQGDRAAALAERLFEDAVGALELYTVYLGERLGLYRALADGGAATSAELAARTGTNERYVREWLEHHAVSGLLEVDDAKAEPRR